MATATDTSTALALRRSPTHALSWAIPAALALAVTAYHWGLKPLWRDEVYTLGFAGRPLPDLWRALAVHDAGLAVYYHLMHAWLQVAGDSPTALRLPGAAAAVIAAAVTGLIGARLAGTAAGVAAGSVLAVMPIVVLHSWEARPYPLLLAAIVVAVYALMRDRDRPQRRWLALWVVASVLSMTLHVLTGAPATGLVLLAAWVSPGRATRRRIILGAAPAVLAGAATVLAGSRQAVGQERSAFSPLRELIDLAYQFGGSTLGVAAVALLTATGALHLWRRTQRLTAAWLLTWAVAPPVLLLTYGAAGGYFQQRYLTSIAPAVALLAGIGVAGLAHTAGHLRLPATAAAVVATAVVVALQLPFAAAFRAAPYYTDSTAAAAASLARQGQAGDAVVYVGYTGRLMTRYYLPTTPLEDVLLQQAPPAGDLIYGVELPADEREQALSRYDRVWIVGTTARGAWNGDFQASIDAAHTGRQRASERDYGQVRVELWTRAT